MKPRLIKDLQFLGRERELCEFSEVTLRKLIDHYELIKEFRSARYYMNSEPSDVLRRAEQNVLARDKQLRLSYLECLIIASFFQDMRIAAEHYGDAATADYAFVHEQVWLNRSDLRSRKVLSLSVRSFWGVTSKYGTDPWRLLITVVIAILFFAILYTPAPNWIESRFPAMPKLLLQDDRNKEEGMKFVDALYFSAITITTVGYGDVKPVNTLARLVVPLEAILGVCLFGVFVTVVTRCVPTRVMGSPVFEQIGDTREKMTEKGANVK